MCWPCSIGGDARNAYAVNEHTHVMGVGDTADGDEHAFVLTPIPEPSTLALVELGAGASILRRTTKDEAREKAAVRGLICNLTWTDRVYQRW